MVYINEIALVSCVSKKQPYNQIKAKNLYDSVWFNKMKYYIENNYSQWFILSMKYGLVHPEQIIDYYDVSDKHTTANYRKNWANEVYQSITNQFDNKTKIDIYAGRKYRQYLIPLLEKSGYFIYIPLLSKGIGEQLQWLNLQNKK